MRAAAGHTHPVAELSCVLHTMWQDPPGWERHTSQRGGGALFLHNPTTCESEWFTGWVQKTSKWYGRKYWFQPTTGRAEWDLPPSAAASNSGSASSAAAAVSSVGQQQSPFVQQQSSDAPTPSSDKVKSWKEKILAAKAKANAAASTEASPPPPPPPPPRAGVAADDDGDSSGDDMEVDADIAGGVELLSPSDIAPAADMLLEDVPSVSLRREELRKDCLQRFADVNEEYGKMIGYSKTCRSCREDGMVVGLSGMFGRFLWVQHMRQTMALASGESTRTSKLPPDPVFPSLENEIDEKLVKELVEGKRSQSQAKRVLQELSSVCRAASVELEVMLQAELPGLQSHIVVLEEEVPTPKGDMGWRPVTGMGARVPGPNPNSSYRLRYVPASAGQTSGRREASFAITGAHLHKTWSAYCRCVGGDPPVWDRNFLRRMFCVLSRYETLSATSDGYQMAFPASGFRLLRHLVSVDCECFASPLNCTLSRFCSVAYDTDKFFGSEGNFFQSEYQQGSFEVCAVCGVKIYLRFALRCTE
ncbi:unnamed protein product [Ectocarpus sp. 4 AP-2014]